MVSSGFPAHDLKRASDIRGCTRQVHQHSSAAAILMDFWEAATGYLVQVHGSAALTLMTLLIARAQSVADRPIVYVAASKGTFFPPDAMDCGVELSRLLVARPRDEVQTGGMVDSFLRSGLVSSLVVDLPVSYRFDLSRLFRFAQVARHTASRLFLFSADDPGLLASSVAMKIQAHYVGTVSPERIHIRFVRSRISQRDVIVPLHARIC